MPLLTEFQLHVCHVGLSSYPHFNQNAILAFLIVREGTHSLAVDFPETLGIFRENNLKYLDNFPGILWDDLILSTDTPVHLNEHLGTVLTGLPGMDLWTPQYI